MTSRVKDTALGTTVLSTMLLAATYASAFLPGGSPAWAPWVFILSVACLLVGLMVLGAARAGRGVGRLALPFTFIWLVLVGGLSAAMLLPPTDPANPTLWLGLPPAAAVLIYGIGLLPVLVTPLAYALTFDELTLSQADLDRVREAHAAMVRDGTAPGAETR